MSSLLKLAAQAAPLRRGEQLLPASPIKTVMQKRAEDKARREREAQREAQREAAEEVRRLEAQALRERQARREKDKVNRDERERKERPSTIRMVVQPAVVTERTPLMEKHESRARVVRSNRKERPVNPFTRFSLGPNDVEAATRPYKAATTTVAPAKTSEVNPFSGFLIRPNNEVPRGRTVTAPASIPTAAPAAPSSSRAGNPFTNFNLGGKGSNSRVKSPERDTPPSIRAAAPQPESRTNARPNVGAQNQKASVGKVSTASATANNTSRMISPPPLSTPARTVTGAVASSSRVSPRHQASTQVSPSAGSRPRVNNAHTSVGNEGKALPQAPSSSSWILVSPKRSKLVRKSPRKSHQKPKPAVTPKQAKVATGAKAVDAEREVTEEVKEARRYFTTIPTSPEVSYAQAVSPRTRTPAPAPPRVRMELAQIPPFRGPGAQGGKVVDEMRRVQPGGRNPFLTPKTRGYPRFVTPLPRAAPMVAQETEDLEEILVSPKDLKKGKRSRRGKKGTPSPAASVEPRREARPVKVANTAEHARIGKSNEQIISLHLDARLTGLDLSHDTAPLQSTRRSTTPPTASTRGPVVPVRPAQSAQVEEGRFYLPLPPQLSAISLAEFASKDSPKLGNTGALYALAKSQFAQSKLALSTAPSPTSSNLNGRSFSSRGDPALQELSRLVKTLRKREDQNKQQVATLVDRVDCLEATLDTTEALVASLEASVLEQYEANVQLKERCEVLTEESIDFEECLQALIALQEENEDLKIKLQAQDTALRISRRGRTRVCVRTDLRERSPSDWVIQEDEGIELGDTKQICRPREDPTDLFGQGFDDERYQRGLEGGVIGQVEMAAYLKIGIIRKSADGGFEMASAPHHQVSVAKAWEIPEETVVEEDDEFF